MPRKLIVLSAATVLAVTGASAQQTTSPTPSQIPGATQNQCWDTATNEVRDRSQPPSTSGAARETVGAGQQPGGVNESQRPPRPPSSAANRPAGMPSC